MSLASPASDPASDAAGAPALTVRDLHKRFGGNHAVRGISFDILPGECVGILGPNGAGKSTTLNICLGKLIKDSGHIRLLGRDMPAQALRARRRLGVVAQNDNLDPDFTCRENLLVYGGYFGMRKQQVGADALLEFAGLSAQADDRISTLSGGMRRRLTLARALVNDPDFIFLDEPTTGLDPQARHLIWERLRRLQAEENKTLLLTTHYLDEAERLCDRLYIIDHGEIIAAGKPDALIREHIEPEVVEFYGDEARRWLDSAAGKLCARYEVFGQIIYCYAKDAGDLLRAAQARGLRFTHRNANLEDVFLTITGRELRE